MAPPIMNSLILFRENVYNIRNFQILQSSTKRNSKIWFWKCVIQTTFLMDKFTITLKSSNFLACLQRKNKKVEWWNLWISALQALRKKPRFYLNVARIVYPGSYLSVTSSTININFSLFCPIHIRIIDNIHHMLLMYHIVHFYWFIYLNYWQYFVSV